jgi:predicted TIM-barrel fold metal-dependent hydrolase
MRYTVERRHFIYGMAATGLSALTGATVGRAESLFPPMSAPAATGLIDVHHHFVPPFYLTENRERIVAASGGKIHPAWSSWTPSGTLDSMDRHGVATTVLSLTFPGVWFGERRPAAEMSRRVNDYAAELVARHPGRFGRFAVIPLPDTDGSLKEIEYALGVLHADGIGLLTSYGDKWLGDAAYTPVFEELNRRKAIVFVHPATAACCRSLLPDVAPMIAEIPQDTTRAIANLLLTGTLSTLPDIRFIFAHAGGTVPMVADRIRQYASGALAERVPKGLDYELRQLYYDIAGTAFRPAIAALTALVPPTQILFGSDSPFIPLAETADGLRRVGFSATDIRRVGRENALGLLPHLKL